MVLLGVGPMDNATNHTGTDEHDAIGQGQNPSWEVFITEPRIGRMGF
jgi:hypothetical protein